MVGSRTKQGLNAAIHQANHLAQAAHPTLPSTQQLEATRCTLNSYLGIVRPLCSHRLRAAAARRISPELSQLIECPEPYHKINIKPPAATGIKRCRSRPAPPLKPGKAYWRSLIEELRAMDARPDAGAHDGT